MLIGSVNHSIDAKGRYIVPAKFRGDLGRFCGHRGRGRLFVRVYAGAITVVALRPLPADDEATLFLKREFFRAYDLK